MRGVDTDAPSAPDPGALEHALPWVSQAAARLKASHPQLPMALVTHGQEMFALQASQRDRNPQVHQLVETLGRDQGIPVHVCETYAGWLFLGFLPVHLGYPFPALRSAGVLPDSLATQYGVLIGSAMAPRR